MSVSSSSCRPLCEVKKAFLLLAACLLVRVCRAPHTSISSSSSSSSRGHPPAWGLLPATAHIHVAPEYFQRCDAVPAPPPTITGGAWLLRELGGPRCFCNSSLSAFLLCDRPQDFGRPPTQGTSPRELQAVDAADNAQPPSVGSEAGEGAPSQSSATSPASAAAAAAPAAPPAASPSAAAGEEAARTQQEGAPKGGAVRARQGSLEPRPKGPHQKKSRSSPHEADKNAHVQQHQQHQQQKQKHQQQKQKQQQQKQQQKQEEQQPHRGGLLSFSSLLSSVLASASVVAATELGDRTFFMCALLAVRYSRRIVFFATCAALFVASAVSVVAGRLLQGAADSSWLPGALKSLLAGGSLVQWVSALFLFCFGLWHLYKACGCRLLHGRGAGAGVHSSRRRLSCSSRSRGPSTKLSPELSSFSTPQDGGGAPEGPAFPEREGEGPLGQREEAEAGEPGGRGASPTTKQGVATHDIVSFDEYEEDSEDEVKESLEEAREDVERLQYTRLGLNPEARRVFREVFLLILLAEWGDKSMFSTISLAAAHNPLGVLIGSCLGHCVVTFAGVLGGLLLQQWLNEHTLNIAAGLLMVAVGVATAADASA
ncbi:hypothetical protein Esti_003679 [Eimeria stiedai]